MNYFSRDELKCKCGCNEYYFDDYALERLNLIRDEARFPFILSSAYRCKDHPIEKAKDRLGEHQTGRAVDVLCWGKQAIRVLELATWYDVPRIGINQKGEHGKRFIHLGWNTDFPVPAIWSY